MSAPDDNYLKLAYGDEVGRALLFGIPLGAAGFAGAIAADKPGLAMLSAIVSVSCLYGALMYGYREWRAHYDFWAAAGLNEEQIRLKWRDLH